MGGSASKTFKAGISPFAVPFTANQCLLGEAPPATVSGVQFTMNMKSMESVVREIASRSLIKTRKQISGFIDWEKALDSDGRRIAVYKNKRIAVMPKLKTMTRIMKYKPSYPGQRSDEYAPDDKIKAMPLYNFAKVVATPHARGGGSAEYVLCTSPTEEKVMLHGKRVPGSKPKYVVFEAATGKCVAKAKLMENYHMTTTFEIAGGVDVAAVLSLVHSLARTGGPWTAGGMAAAMA